MCASILHNLFLPQVILNLRLQTTSGQSRGSVLIAMAGKTTDFLGNFILVLPKQYVIMTYFSSSVAYVNGLQVLWYYETILHDSRRDSNISDPPYDSLSSPAIQYENFGEKRHYLKLMSHCTGHMLVRLVLGFILCGLLTACLIGLILNFGLWGLTFPIAILAVLFVAYLTRNRPCTQCQDVDEKKNAAHSEHRI